MGWGFNPVSAFKSAGKAIASGAKSVASAVKSLGSSVATVVKSVGTTVASKVQTVGNAVGSLTQSVGNKLGVADNIGEFADKVKSGAGIAKDWVKNSLSEESMAAFIEGYKNGGLINAIGSAAASTTFHTMAENDKSGKYNPDYAYKLGGFPNNDVMNEAYSMGYDTWDKFNAMFREAGYSDYYEWKKLQNAPQGSANEVVVTPDNGGAPQVQSVEGLTVVTPPASVQSASGMASAVSVAKKVTNNKYDADTVELRTTVIR